MFLSCEEIDDYFNMTKRCVICGDLPYPQNMLCRSHFESWMLVANGQDYGMDDFIYFVNRYRKKYIRPICLVCSTNQIQDNDYLCTSCALVYD